MVLVTLQARLTTPRLASLCVRAGLEANYVSHHHRTLDLIRIQERSSVTETLLLALNLQGMQNDCDMIPLMMQSNFKPKGWRKSRLKAALSAKLHRHAVDVRSFCS